MKNELKPFWSKYFNFDWRFGLFSLLIICIPRFILVLNANETSNYGYIALIMTISAIVPFVFLSKSGRKEIGLSIPKKYSWLFWSFFWGLVFSVLLYFVGYLIYKNSPENWYVYIGKSYNIPCGIEPNDKLIMFTIMAISGMILVQLEKNCFLEV